MVYQINGFPSSRDVSFKKHKPQENPNLFEGDMRFPNTSPLVRGVLRRGNSVAWTNGIVPYEISSEYEPSDRALLIDIMRQMERLIAINNVQCIQFRPRIPSDQYYITIRNGDEDQDEACSSFVGQNTGVDMERTVTLSILHCLSEGLVMHELLHVLGFYHEQSRPDRDNYVQIIHSNIEPGMEFNFEKYDNSYVDTQNTPYDYSSIMHYDPYVFSSNGLPTIEPLDENAEIGQRFTMSPIDIEEVRLFYNCPSNGITLPTISPITKVNTTISSSLTTNSLTYDRTSTYDNYYYESYEVYASSDGYYTFISNSSIDTYGCLYKEDFDPNDQNTNLMEVDDEAGGLSQFRLISFLESNTRYILVVTTYYPLVTGNYQLIISDSPSVDIKKLNNISILSTTTIPMITTSSSQFLSTYSSALTENSLTFTRYGANGIYYYEAIIISVSTNGLYTFESNSTIDSYGYLYVDNFDSRNPVTNLLRYNDDHGSENSQFLIAYELKSNKRYILIQITYVEDDDIGFFSITASGPGTIQFNRMSNPAA